MLDYIKIYFTEAIPEHWLKLNDIMHTVECKTRKENKACPSDFKEHFWPDKHKKVNNTNPIVA